MDRYIDALVSKEKNSLIPDEDDWYAPLIGDWKYAKRMKRLSVPSWMIQK